MAQPVHSDYNKKEFWNHYLPIVNNHLLQGYHDQDAQCDCLFVFSTTLFENSSSHMSVIIFIELCGF